jgi:hypothetical protein
MVGSVEDRTGEGVAEGSVGGETAGHVGSRGGAGVVAGVGDSYTAGRKVGETDGAGLRKAEKEEGR